MQSLKLILLIGMLVCLSQGKVLSKTECIQSCQKTTFTDNENRYALEDMISCSENYCDGDLNNEKCFESNCLTNTQLKQFYICASNCYSNTKKVALVIRGMKTSLDNKTVVHKILNNQCTVKCLENVCSRYSIFNTQRQVCKSKAASIEKCVYQLCNRADREQCQEILKTSCNVKDATLSNCFNSCYM